MRHLAASVFLSCIVLLATAAAVAVDLGRRVQFDIPAQSLATALLRFSEQAAVQLAAPSKLLVGLKTDGIHGEYPMDAALVTLLQGTGLTFQAFDDRTVAIRRDTPTASGTTRRDPSEDGSQHVHPAAGSNGHAYLAETASPQAPAASEIVGEVVVTGTHIRGAAPAGSPLLVYDREYIDQSGVATVEQFVRKLPQNFALIDADTTRTPRDPQAGANVSKGSSINLRGLGAGSTLILLDGHRLAPGGGDASFVDVSMIPLSAIERVEVLTDGASAIYGADAVAGVVNFVLRKNFEGAESSVRFGDTTDGARERSVSQLLGTAWTTGSAMVVAELHDQDGLRADQRDFIPDQGGPFQILPEQQRRSFILSGRQDIGHRVSTFLDASFSQREFTQDSTEFGVTQHAEGETRQYGGVLGFSFDISDEWRAELVANYSRKNELLSSAILGTPATSFETRAAVASGELRADGPVLSTYVGEARASIGGGRRREKFDDPVYGAGTGLQRNVDSIYGELLLPIVSGSNARPLVPRLTLSLAVRLDDYDDVGSSTNPKVGVLWSPVRGLDLRGSYATSFRAPGLARTSDANPTFVLFPLPNPADMDGQTITVLQFASGNPALKPEEAESFTVGLDVRPASLSGLLLSATYFEIDYTNRVAMPPLVGSPFLIFSQLDTLAPFVDLTPDPARVAAIFADNVVADPFGISGAPVEAVYDGRPHNFAASRASGIDFSASYEATTRVGDLGFALAGEKLLEADYQAVFTVPTVRLLDRVYEPVDLKLRGVFSWARSGFSSSLAINYVDGYQNDLVTPVESIDSWTTLDWQLSYTNRSTKAPSVLQGFAVTLSVQNITNQRPPYVASSGPSANFGYDPTNASPRGRIISAQLTKRWGR